MLFLLLLILASSEKGAFSTDQDALSQRCLRAHNDYRVRHGAPPLSWSGELADEAQNWANHLAAIDQMERDPNTKEGENIFYMYGGDPSEACDRAVENWYSEVKNYDFKNPQDNPSTDHFSQVVWKTTKEIGVGTAKSKSGNFFLVARYNPKGNTDGAFLDNVHNALDVFLTLNPKESQDTTGDKPKETSEPKQETHKPNDKASTGPIVNIATTASPDSLADGMAENSPASLPTIFEKKVSEKNPIKDISKNVHTNSNEIHGDGNLELSSHDKTNLGSTPKEDPSAEMNVKPPKDGKDFQVELRFPNIKFTEKMSYSSSKDFEEVRIEITSSILQLYDGDDDFQEVQLISLRNGSVIATLGFIFAKDSSGHLDKLTSAVAMGKLGELEVSRDYVAVGAVAEGYLKLTLPHQPLLKGECPQPCSNPKHCFSTGCHVGCCAFHPTPSLITTHAQHTYTQPVQPSCPGNCDATCLPQCTADCCLNNEPTPGLQQDAPQPTVPQQPVQQPEVSNPEVNQPEVNHTYQGYSCPATCPFSCYPQCTPECCSTPAFFEKPDCSDDCANVCSVSCPQDCCAARKSNVNNIKHLAHSTGSHALLPPLVNPKSSRLAHMYESKSRAVRKHIFGKGFQHGSKAQYEASNVLAYFNKILSYKKPNSALVKAMQKLPYRTKSVSVKNPVSFKQKAMYSRPGKTAGLQKKFSYKKIPTQRAQTTKTLFNSRINKADYFAPQTTPGMKPLKDLKSHGAPLDIKFAYRYGNRLLVPIDMPNMDIKELKGKKLISVPAFKRSLKKEQNSYDRY